MRLLVLLLIGATYGQVAQRSVVMTVTAGASYCTFTNYRPMALTGLHIDCASRGSSMKLDVPLAAGATGITGVYSDGPDVIRWEFVRPPADGALMYKVVANGQSETGLL